jgi:hypothetical protein
MLAYYKCNYYVIYGDATNYKNIEQCIDLLGLVLPCPLQPILIFMTFNLAYLEDFWYFYGILEGSKLPCTKQFISKLDENLLHNVLIIH